MFTQFTNSQSSCSSNGQIDSNCSKSLYIKRYSASKLKKTMKKNLSSYFLFYPFALEMLLNDLTRAILYH